MTKATVIADASHCHRLNVGGWAAWVRVDDFKTPIKGYGVLKGKLPDATVCEVYAALNGVWLAVQYGADDILLRTDCMAVVHLVHREIKSKRLQHVWREATSQPWFKGVRVLSARHVPGHGKIVNAATFVNDWCDAKAKFAMKQARQGNPCYEVSP